MGKYAKKNTKIKSIWHELTDDSKQNASGVLPAPPGPAMASATRNAEAIDHRYQRKTPDACDPDQTTVLHCGWAHAAMP